MHHNDAISQRARVVAGHHRILWSERALLVQTDDSNAEALARMRELGAPLFLASGRDSEASNRPEA